ncbi:hypothetical protein [Haloarcula halophila]|uniref:hypothetical protein n=1 Tax=Halomicroarcula sp. GCM10025335 TaxID=3252668 RepID=UPI003613091A
METLSTKVPPSMKEEIEEYADEIEETRSTAMRELLRAGLDAEESRRSPNPILFGATTAGIVIAALSVAGNVDAVVGVVGAMLALGALAADRWL